MKKLLLFILIFLGGLALHAQSHHHITTNVELQSTLNTVVAGAPSSTPTLCVNSALTAITHTTIDATGIGTAEELPDGVSAHWAANLITISGTPTNSGVFSYKIPVIGSCGTDTAKGTITVTAASEGGTVAITTGSSPVCAGTNSTILTLSGHTGSVVRWESSPNGTNWSNIANTATTYTVSDISTSTQYRAVVQSSPCAEASSTSVSINIFTQDNLEDKITCTGSFQFNMAAATGPAPITYSWEQSSDNVTWSTVPDATIANPTLTATSNTYFRRIATSSVCGTSITSNAALVTNCRPAIPTFMAYNLGADPSLNTPAKQMAYLANDANGATATTTNYGRVFGGRYQWGRRNLPYAINPSTYLLYAGYGTANHTVAWASTMTYTNGQLDGQNDYHVYNDVSPYDWSAPPNNTLWGNGEQIYTPTPGIGAVLHTDGNYYQKPVKTVNDPCPSGYRVPTQNDWELMCNYDCNPTSDYDDVAVSNSGVGKATSGLTWVQVQCSGGTCKMATLALNARGGYAVYRTSDWESAGYTAADDLTSAIPQPVLFLPAVGYRSNTGGTVLSVGSVGLYWSSSISGNISYMFTFNRIGVTPRTIDYRTAGYSVRCVAE